MKALPTKDPILCMAACSYGGLSSARKYSRTNLGYHQICNRRVRAAGERCWQHRDGATDADNCAATGETE